MNKKKLDLKCEGSFSCKQCSLYEECSSQISRIKITNLMNSFHFFCDYVLVLHLCENHFQLIVINDNEVLMNKFFPSLSNAQQAFLNQYEQKIKDCNMSLFSSKSSEQSINPFWDTYFPCSDWLEEKTNLLQN